MHAFSKKTTFVKSLLALRSSVWNLAKLCCVVVIFAVITGSFSFLTIMVILGTLPHIMVYVHLLASRHFIKKLCSSEGLPSLEQRLQLALIFLHVGSLAFGLTAFFGILLGLGLAYGYPNFRIAIGKKKLCYIAIGALGLGLVVFFMGLAYAGLWPLPYILQDTPIEQWAILRKEGSLARVYSIFTNGFAAKGTFYFTYKGVGWHWTIYKVSILRRFSTMPAQASRLASSRYYHLDQLFSPGLWRLVRWSVVVSGFLGGFLGFAAATAKPQAPLAAALLWPASGC